ncbi:MAG TPA: COX15/CtaA family protein [Candidatus Eisenbacteria bacterium]|nr:COX15/CtaA family protein [Candidatus Eisenbacteria bacterium]
MNERRSPLASLLITTLVLLFVLVVWGGVVRLSGSGLAIPDWPLAEGKLLPRPHPNVLIEYAHRALAGTVGLLTAAIAFLVFRSAVWRPRLGGWMTAAILVLGLQIFIGGRVVLEELPIDRVVTHLLLAFVFFALLLAITLRVQDGPDGRPRAAAGQATGLARWAGLASFLVLGQVALGGWVSSSGAALACPDFPTCHGSWLPRMEGLVGIHYAHRLGAYVVTLVILALLVRSASVSLPSKSRWILRISGILLGLQFTLGVANVLLRLPLPVSAAHLGTALILFGSLRIASHELSRA